MRFVFRQVFLAALFLSLIQTGDLFCAPSTLQVETEPSELFPGQAALLRVTSQREVTSVSATFLKQKILFFRSKGGMEWIGLAGVSLDVSPGVHSLSYTVRYADGGKNEGIHSVKILRKDFPVERIHVDKKFVQLSRSDLVRVRREKQMLTSIYREQSPFRSWEKGFTVPVSGRRGSPFGLRRIFNGEPRNPHSGADLKAKQGTPVHASDSGRVVFAGNLFFSGNVVILNHGGGLFTIYAHLHDMRVGEGKELKKGDVVGHVGATGRVTGPHLHWGAVLNGVKVDPFTLVSLPLPLH